MQDFGSELLANSRAAVLGLWHLAADVHHLHRRIETMAQTIQEVRDDYRGAFQAVKDQRDAALALAAANATKADTSAKALADALDADAADDLVQLSNQQSEDAALFAADLAALKDQPAPELPADPEPTPEPAPGDETPVPDPEPVPAPVEDVPVDVPAPVEPTEPAEPAPADPAPVADAPVPDPGTSAVGPVDDDA